MPSIRYILYKVQQLQGIPRNVTGTRYTRYKEDQVQGTPGTGYTSIHQVRGTPCTEYAKYMVHLVQGAADSPSKRYNIDKVNHVMLHQERS